MLKLTPYTMAPRRWHTSERLEHNVWLNGAARAALVRMGSIRPETIIHHITQNGFPCTHKLTYTKVPPSVPFCSYLKGHGPLARPGAFITMRLCAQRLRYHGRLAEVLGVCHQHVGAQLFRHVLSWRGAVRGARLGLEHIDLLRDTWVSELTSQLYVIRDNVKTCSG